MNNDIITIDESFTITDVLYLIYRLLNHKKLYPVFRFNTDTIEVHFDTHSLDGRVNVSLLPDKFFSDLYFSEIFENIKQNNTMIKLFYTPKSDKSAFIFNSVTCPIFNKKMTTGFLICYFRYICINHITFKAQVFVDPNNNQQNINRIYEIDKFWRFLTKLTITESENFNTILSTLKQHCYVTRKQHTLTANIDFYQYTFNRFNINTKLCDITASLYDRFHRIYRAKKIDFYPIKTFNTVLNKTDITNWFYKTANIDKSQLDRVISVSNIIRYLSFIYNIMLLNNEFEIKRNNKPFYCYLTNQGYEYNRKIIMIKFLKFTLQNSYFKSKQQDYNTLMEYNNVLYESLLAVLILNLLIQDTKYEKQLDTFLSKIELELF